jgi:surface antigen
MKKLIIGGIVLASLGLAGCQTSRDQSVNKQQMGTLGGAVVGGILASNVGSGSGQLWATGAGVLLGALVGSEIGASLDRADMIYAEKAVQQAHTSPIGETISWNNPDSGNAGTVTPVRDGYSQVSNSYCREYEQTIYVDGRQEIGYGTACQQEDGRWKVVN